VFPKAPVYAKRAMGGDAELGRDGLVAQLRDLIDHECTGTLFLSTADGDDARFGFYRGRIVGLAWRSFQGAAALDGIKRMRSMRASVSYSVVFRTSAALPPTEEIVRRLHVS
jgi:hypothetical protein